MLCSVNVTLGKCQGVNNDEYDIEIYNSYIVRQP